MKLFEREELPLEQTKVEKLISGVLQTYHALNSIDSDKYCITKSSSGGLFNASCYVTPEQHIDLAALVGVVFNLDLKYDTLFLPEKEFTGVFMLDDDAEKIVNYGSGVIGSLEGSIAFAVETYQKHIAEAKEKIDSFAKLKENLDEALGSDNKNKLIDAFEKMGELTGWSTKVVVPDIYKAGNDMAIYALSLSKLGIAPLFDVSAQLSETLDNSLAEVRWANPYVNKVFPSLKPREPTVDYSGPLDLEVIAEDMVRG